MATVSLSRLHQSGDVTVEIGHLDDYNIPHDTDMPQWFRDMVTVGTRTYRLTPEQAGELVTDGIADASPAGWTFGYPHAYVGDGFLLCPACVEKQVTEQAWGNGVDPEQMACQLFVYGEMPQSGDTCDQCSEYIPGVAPYCGDCLEHDHLIYSDAGDRVLCRFCLADRLLETRRNQVKTYRDPAYLVGVNTIRTDNTTYRHRT